MRIFKTLLTSIVFISITSVATAARYDRDNFEYAPVVDAQPIYERQRQPQNRRICQNTRRGDSRNHRNYSREHRSSGGGALLGGIIGGLLGNRFGDGRGRDAATAAGIIAGATLGSQSRSNNGRYSNNSRRNGRQCRTQRDYYEEEIIVGYNVSYDYNGRIYHTKMQNHPGERVRINVNVNVAEY